MPDLLKNSEPRRHHSVLNKTFSHIYIEKGAADYPLTQKILSRFKNSAYIYIEHYKDVFCRSKQSYDIQKSSPKLILAVNRKVELHSGSELCDDYGHENFFYVTHIMNCLYDCEYCYLSGMYPSANVVVFVNIGDYFTEVKKKIKDDPIYICASYDTDILAFEGMTGIFEEWVCFCGDNKAALLEIRTKSGNYKSISHLKPLDNVILAWTLSPAQIIERYERGAASLEARLQSAKAAISDGWQVRLCIDPVIYIPGWETVYKDACREIREELAGLEPVGISAGAFRVPKVFYKRMKHVHPDSALLSYPFENRDGVICYDRELEDRMVGLITDELSMLTKNKPVSPSQ